MHCVESVGDVQFDDDVAGATFVRILELVKSIDRHLTTKLCAHAELTGAQLF